MDSNKELQGLTKSADQLYRSYTEARDAHKNTLIITLSNAPNPVGPYRSIYPMGQSYDLINQAIKEFYERKGIRCIVSGPSGLGASGEYLGFILDFITTHKDTIVDGLKNFGFILKYLRWIYSFAINKRNSALLVQQRLIKPKVSVRLDLYIPSPESANDPIPYAQQLAISCKELFEVLSKKIDHFEYTFEIVVKFTSSETHIHISIGDDIRRISQIVAKMNAIVVNNESIDINTDKGIFGTKIRFTHHAKIQENSPKG